jgi:type VII secretion protein EccE
MTARIALASLFIVPAAMAYPWRSVTDRWLLGVAVVVVLVLFARWRGAFLTTIAGRRLAMWWRRNRRYSAHQPSEYTTVLLKVDPTDAALPLPLITGYLDRYGIRCDKVRVTSRDRDGDRTTWIGVTVGAADNLAALRARSPRIPLQDTAEVVGRWLANHLREIGWRVAVVDTADDPTPPDAKETWRGLRDASGYVAAYRVAPDVLTDVRALSAPEIWTALELTGTAADTRYAAACAVRSGDKPAGMAGMTPLNGRHRPALAALNPLSVERLISTRT